jgi:outer membrane protein TolC
VTQLAGASTSESLSQPANFGFSQTLPNGAQYTVSFAASKNSSNSSYALLNPNINTGLTVNVTQPLLRNSGYYVNHLNLMMARSRYRIADFTLKSQLLQLVQSAESAYWDVIQARENLHVAESALKLAQDSKDLADKEFKLGAISQLDLYNPEQQLATAQLGVSQAKFSLEQSENALRKQMAVDLDPDVRKVPIQLSEPVEMAGEPGILDSEAEVAMAFQLRPDLKALTQSLDVDDLSFRSAKNELLPSLSLTGSYQSQGIGGVLNPFTNPVSGGFGDALSQMFGFGFPVYSFGLNLQLPIRSHAAAADLADALVQKKRDTLTIRTSQQQVRLNILNAVSNFESSKKSVELAKIAESYAEKYLDAENQKFQLGIDPMQFVLQAQNALTQAQSAVVQAQVGLRRNQLSLLTQTGELLDKRGIVVQ